MGVQLANLTLAQLKTLSLDELEGMTLELRTLEQLSLDELDALTLAELAQLGLATSFSGAGRGRHRVANLSLVEHRLHRGDGGASPDFDAEPWDAWSALGLEGLHLRQLAEISLDDLDTLRLDALPYPHTSPKLLGLSYLGLDDLEALSLAELDDMQLGGGTYRLVTRRRNEWGLESANRGETLLAIGDDGAEDGLPPTAPTEIDIEPAAGGAFRITAKYCYGPDGDLAADAWLVYFTSNGVDPDPDGDVPTEVAIAKADGVARLNYTTSPFTAGTTGKAIVRVDRSGVESVNTAVVSATAATAGPAAPTAAAHFGGLATQG